ncbi:MAG: hypothetical protein RL095_4199 [Verrucomicrobiota bacterium]|jgi:hypothetical protein
MWLSEGAMFILSIILLLVAAFLFFAAPKSMRGACRFAGVALLLVSALLNFFTGHRAQLEDVKAVDLGQAVQDAGFHVPITRLSARLGAKGKIAILGPVDHERLGQIRKEFPDHEFTWTGGSASLGERSVTEQSLKQAIGSGAAAVICIGVAPEQAEALFYKEDESALYPVPILVMGSGLGLAPLVARGGLYAVVAAKPGMIVGGGGTDKETLFAAHFDWIEGGGRPPEVQDEGSEL